MELSRIPNGMSYDSSPAPLPFDHLATSRIILSGNYQSKTISACLDGLREINWEKIDRPGVYGRLRVRISDARGVDYLLFYLDSADHCIMFEGSWYRVSKENVAAFIKIIKLRLGFDFSELEL